MKHIWTRAGAYPGSGHQYSTTAVKGVLKKHGGFVDVFRAFAGANTIPAQSYPEGRSWPTAPVAATWTLSRDAARKHTRMPIDHMSSRNVAIKPAAELRDKRWKLRVVVDGPAAQRSPAAYLVVRTRHGVQRKVIHLNRKGVGRTQVGFSARRVRWAKVVLVNASTRFSCWHRTSWSCQGKAQDDDQKFTLRAVARRTR